MKSEDLIYVGFFDDIPIFIDETIKEPNIGYLLDLNMCWVDGEQFQLNKGKIVLLSGDIIKKQLIGGKRK